MFQIGLTIGWAALMILLLCIRADIRELSAIMKESRREQLRNSFGGRKNEVYPNFQEEIHKETREAKTEERRTSSTLNQSEEQVLKEVLTEFLG